MNSSFVEYGKNICRARFASSGSEMIGNVEQNGCIGTPFDVCGKGCVGHAASPGTSEAVGTVISMIGLIGFPFSRLKSTGSSSCRRNQRP
jgi:hypothetical protein